MLTLAPGMGLAATVDGPQFILLPGKASVTVLVLAVPDQDVDGFHLERANGNGNDFTRVTKDPVRAVTGQQAGLAVLGKDAADILEALDVSTVAELFTDEQAHPDKYTLLSFYSLPLSELLGRLHKDTTVTPGATYTYRVVLVDAQGQTVRTLNPQTIAVTPPDLREVTGLTATAQDGRATLSWDKLLPGDGVEIGWVVERATSADGPFQRVNQGVLSRYASPSFLDAGLNNGTPYWYRVTTVDLAGTESDASGVVTVTPRDTTPPAPPSGLNAEVKGPKQAVVTWKVNMEPDMASYDVYRGFGVEGPFEKLPGMPLSADVMTYTDTAVPEGKAIFYRLTATDTTGNESQPSATRNLLPQNTTPPPTPRGVTAVHGQGTAVVVSWQPVVLDDLMGYRVYRGPDPDHLEQANSSLVSKSTATFTDTITTAGTTYYYTVTAVDTALNESKNSDPVKTTAPDPNPPSPPGSVFAHGEDDRILVSWAPNHEPDLAGYRLYRSTGENGTYQRVGGDLPATPTEYEDKGTDTAPLQKGTLYWYYITALDLAGNESEPSHKTFTKPHDKQPPPPPEGLRAAWQDGRVSLQWSPTQETDLAGYHVWRGTHPTGVYTQLTQGKPLPPGTTTYTDTTVSTGQPYWYQLTAVDTSGNASPRSDAAGPVNAPQQKEDADE